MTLPFRTEICFRLLAFFILLIKLVKSKECCLKNKQELAYGNSEFNNTVYPYGRGYGLHRSRQRVCNSEDLVPPDQGKTVLVIAHRMRSVARADKNVVPKDGRNLNGNLCIKITENTWKSAWHCDRIQAWMLKIRYLKQ